MKPGRPVKKSKDLMDYRVAVKLTAELYQKLKTFAAQENVSMSEYLRRLVRFHSRNAKTIEEEN